MVSYQKKVLKQCSLILLLIGSVLGGLIVLVQTSPESPQIYRLIQRLIVSEKLSELKESALKADVSDDDFKAFMVYSSGVLANMGNYKSFGDSKIIPNLPKEKLEAITKASKAFAQDGDGVQAICDSCCERIYSLSDKQAQLGLGEKGVTKYFSDNCTQEDSDKINRYFKKAKIEGYINRVVKTKEGDDGKTKYEIRNAAVKDGVLSQEEFEGAVFQVTHGDYQKLLEKVNENLALAKVGIVPAELGCFFKHLFLLSSDLFRALTAGFCILFLQKLTFEALSNDILAKTLSTSTQK